MYLEVVITNQNHPHANEEGMIEVIDGKITFITPFKGADAMIEIDLTNCRHGVQSTLATRDDFRLKELPKRHGKLSFNKDTTP